MTDVDANLGKVPLPGELHLQSSCDAYTTRDQ